MRPCGHEELQCRIDSAYTHDQCYVCWSYHHNPTYRAIFDNMTFGNVNGTAIKEALAAEPVTTQAEVPGGCECSADGFCRRFRRPMVGRLREICRGVNCDPGEAAKFRAIWSAEALAMPMPGANAENCPHRSTEAIQVDGRAKTRGCGTCAGNVQQKLFSCNHPALTPHETAIVECGTCLYRPRNTEGAHAIVLRNNLCPGDVLVMSAAIYSLHQANPGKFLTAVETTAMPIWEHNPDVVPAESLKSIGPITLEAHYPLVNRSNQHAIHFMQAYCSYLEDALGVKVPLMTNRPMIYLSKQEKTWINQVEEVTQKKQRFWLINSGIKNDYTSKAYGQSQYQRVVDLLRGKVVFVQIGESGHNHPPLRGVINLVGKTDTRQLIRLAHHCDGIVTGVSFPMHLAAAMEKPCVAIMGGREPVVWNSYPRMTLLHTVGALDCCREGGCWRSRIVPLGDNDEKDKSLCEHPIPGDEPVGKCMGIISPESVAEAVLRYAV